MATLIAFLLIALLAVGSFFLWRLLIRRAMRVVVGIFREHKALTPESAAPLEKMGLQDHKPVMGMIKFGDYRQTAMQVFAQDCIIMTTGDERYFLSEDALARSRWHAFAKIR